jgi:hypothetical protein
VDKYGQFHATGTGKYPQEFTFEVLMPESWSYEPFYWIQMEEYMRRYRDHLWWCHTIPGPPAVWRVLVVSSPVTGVESDQTPIRVQAELPL